MRLLDTEQPGALTLQRLSIERIAREAGVSKTTIYRWWPSKVAIVIETFVDNHVAHTPVRDDLPAIDALREHHASVADIYAGTEGRLIAQLIAECQYDPAAMADFKKGFYDERLSTAMALVERAMTEGVVRADLDPHNVAELLYAPLYFRLLFADGSLDRASAAEIFDLALAGASATPGQHSDRRPGEPSPEKNDQEPQPASPA